MKRKDKVSRREFVKAGVVTAGAVTVAGLPLVGQADEPASQPEKKGKPKKDKKIELVPTRVLGRTGEKISMLCFGAGQPQERMFTAMWEAGIRYADTADCYVEGRHEKELGEWMKKTGHRKDMFIVTKDHPNTPDQFVEMVDARLKNMQTDYIDLYFIHGLGEPDAGYKITLDEMIEVPKAKEWAAAAEKIRKSKKVKYIGFAMHGEVPARLQIMKNAISGGWTDAIMLMYDAQLVRENKDFNKALDACHKAGIGMISMKQMRRLHEAKRDVDKQGEVAAGLLPKFKEMGLTPYQAVLHSVWTDERITSICSAMANLDILKENVAAARKFKPLGKKEMAAVLELYRQQGTRLCTACDGSCRRAAGTDADLNKIVRYLSYFEMDGRRADARRYYAQLTSTERTWQGANLEAASKACRCHVDFAALLPRAEEKLA